MDENYLRLCITCIPENMVFYRENNRAGTRIDTKSEVSEIFWMPEWIPLMFF